MADEQTTDVTNSQASPDQGEAQTGALETPSSSTTATNDDPLAATTVLTEDADGAKPGDDGGNASADENGEASKDGAEALIGAPEGDYEITLPDGVALDADALAAVTPVAKELNLSNAGLSKLAEVYTEKVLPQATKAATDALVGQVVEQRAAWDADTRRMVLGGKAEDGSTIAPDPMFAGKSLDQVRGVSAKAIARFGGEDFKTFLNETGLGNDPRMVRFAYQAGSLISEDNDFHRPGSVPSTPKSREEKYYGTA